MRRFWIILLIGIFGVILAYFVVRLNYEPTQIKSSKGYLNIDVLDQLQFLKQELPLGADDEMQAIFPEGYVFINVLYGLTWANLVTTSGRDSSIYTEGVSNIKLSIHQLNSERALYPFYKGLPLANGAFYRGWTNYLLGKMLMSQYPKDRDSLDLAKFSSNCKEIKNAFENSPTIYLDTYAGEIWPADNIICLASLALYDQIFPGKYNLFLRNQVAKMKTVLDPNTGLIPHSMAENKVLEGARGSSKSLINVFLIEIDSAFARQQFAIYQSTFLDRRLGLQGIREYPKGKEGEGDIDAGPIVWDIGGAGSIVGVAAASVNGDKQLSRSLRNSVETFGIPFTINDKKRYLLGVLPMADAFIAWVNSFDKYYKVVKG